MTVTDHVDRLVSRIASRDREAFRSLYGFLAVQVWRSAASALPGGDADAAVVTESTFLAVWHGAGNAPRHDARAWIGRIAAARIGERCRSTAPRGGVLEVYDEHTRLEVAGLLGAGPGTVRTGPATFRRVDPLTGALDLVGAPGPA